MEGLKQELPVLQLCMKRAACPCKKETSFKHPAGDAALSQCPFLFVAVGSQGQSFALRPSLEAAGPVKESSFLSSVSWPPSLGLLPVWVGLGTPLPAHLPCSWPLSSAWSWVRTQYFSAATLKNWC